MDLEQLSLLFRVGIAAGVAVIGYVVAFLARWGFQKAFLRFRGDATIVIFLSHILFWLIFIPTLISAINQTGLYTTSLVAAFGAVFAALIISLQKTLANFAGGVILLLRRPYKIGDIITIMNIKGRVVEINVFSTHLDLGENTALIPNGVITESPLIIERSTKR